MHVTLQFGGRSPKQANMPTSTSQLKPASDSGKNSGSSFHSQAKGKKRERGDHGADSVKRERSSRLDDSVQCNTESTSKYDIARITENGGIVNLKGVEKLVKLMQPDRRERKMDLVSRSMLASVMASTDKVDCLNRFVQLRGLLVLDEWLQDIHKGKIGDGNNIKEGDKSVEEFLLVLLCALDKLPVNLQALQMSNIGRSVNHLRSHKNIDIQRKARTLVDTWKKRVEAEMISIDAKSVTTQAVSAWTSKSRLPEASHAGGRSSSGSGVATNSSLIQNSAAKVISSRFSTGESSIKYEISSPGPVKTASSLASVKESQPSVGGTADALQIREDRGSSSNQPHNQGQDFSAKDDRKSSPSGSVTANKISSSSSRNRKISGFLGISATGSRKRTSSCKSPSSQKSTGLEKLSQSALATERAVEGPIVEGNSHNLVVNLPNCVRSCAQGVSGGSLEDASVLLNKQEQSDHASKDKSDASHSSVVTDINTYQIDDSNNVLTGSEGAGSPAVRDEVLSMTTDDTKRLIEGPPTNQSKSVRLHASSFSPMNALVESCAKYSEATSSFSLDDDVGMNLLASVAAGEMSRSDVVSPTDSTERSTLAVEEVCPHEDCPREVQNQIYNDGECDGMKQAVSNRCSGDLKCAQSLSIEDIPAGKSGKDFADTKWDSSEKSNAKKGTSSTEKLRYGESHGVHGGETTFSNVIADGASKCASGGIGVMGTEEKDSTDECKLIVEVAGTKPLDEGDGNLLVTEGLDRITISQQRLSSTVAESEFAERANNEKLRQTECGVKSVSEADGVAKVYKPHYRDINSYMIKAESHRASVSCSTSHDLNRDCIEANLEKKEIPEHVSLHESRCPGSVDCETLEAELTGSMSARIQADETGKCAFTGDGAAPSSAGGATYPRTKIKFDLNEGFCGGDDKCEESVTSTSFCSTTVHMPNSLPLSLSSIPNNHFASITVASAAKRQFVPPEDLLRRKVELGWKGSAATSAFRPAEPRKVNEMALGPSNSSCPDASTSKNNRFPLDIDLNVPDESALEEMVSRGSDLAVKLITDIATNCAALLNGSSNSTSLRGSGGLDLDLNIVDEANDTGNCSISSNHHGESSIVHVKPLSRLHVLKDFDLNNGPAVDDASTEQFSINQVGKSGAVSRLPSATSLNNQVPSSFTSWFSPGNTYSTIAIPSVLPDRGDQPFPVLTPGASQRTFIPAGVTPFNPDIYRGSVLSSSPAVPFPSSPFQFPVFRPGTTFPLPSANISAGGPSYPDSSSGARLSAPPVNPQFLAPVGSVASQFQRPYEIGLPGISNNGGLVSNIKWGRQSLDLNVGPGTMESEVKEEMFPLSSGQHSVASLQALAEEQDRMFSVSVGMAKRETDGGLGNEPCRFKPSSRH